LITERIYGEIGNNINIYCVIASSQDAAVSPARCSALSLLISDEELARAETPEIFP
jgi:hypothetical protein